MAHMARLDDSKARLERVLGRFEAAALKMHGVAAENQRLSGLLAKSAEAQRVLSLAAADALAEVDQAIAMIAGQADTAGSVPVEAPDDLPGELGFEGAEQDEAQASPDQNPSAGDAIGGLMLSLGVTQPARDAGSAEASPSQEDDAGTAGDLPPEQDEAGEDKKITPQRTKAPTVFGQSRSCQMTPRHRPTTLCWRLRSRWPKSFLLAKRPLPPRMRIYRTRTSWTRQTWTPMRGWTVWPLFAVSTASAESMRMALARSRCEAVIVKDPFGFGSSR